MSYTPNPKALVYQELQFVSTSVPMPQAKTLVDYDLLYDDVSSEIFAIFVGEPVEMKSEAVRDYATLQSVAGVEIAN